MDCGCSLTAQAGVGLRKVAFRLGEIGVAAGLCGYLYKRIPMLLRIIMIAGGIAMMVPGTLTDVIGLVALLVIVLFQKRGVETAAA